MDETRYQEWRNAKLAGYPVNVHELFVEIGGLGRLSQTEQAAVRARCRRCNMAIYQCRDPAADRLAVARFAARFGLRHLDFHLCANADGVSEISVAEEGVRTGYAPYSNRSLSWHTDGYYNDPARQVRAVVLHCAESSAAGGENALLDPEIAYIRLRDANPAFITALQHPECMTIPANTGDDGGNEIRPAVTGPVFSRNPRDGALQMRYSARKRNIQWRDDPLTRDAITCLTELLTAADGPVLRHRLQAGEGLISNNVLHNRTTFDDGPGQRRLLYRARFYDRIESGS
jgi:alpha-ketoglutarate-dependent taurine dioxygenase